MKCSTNAIQVGTPLHGYKQWQNQGKSSARCGWKGSENHQMHSLAQQGLQRILWAL